MSKRSDAIQRTDKGAMIKLRSLYWYTNGNGPIHLLDRDGEDVLICRDPLQFIEEFTALLRDLEREARASAREAVAS